MKRAVTTNKLRQPVRDVFLERKERLKILLSESSITERDARIKAILSEHLNRAST